MRTQELLSNFAAYNQWANESLVKWLQAKPVEQLSEEVESGYNSLLKTLNHIWAVEQFWHGFLSGQASGGEARYMATTFDPAEILPGLLAQSKALCAYVQSLSDADLDKRITVDFPWIKGTDLQGQLIMHMFNHSTYHRGQLASIGRRLGFTDAPWTDFNCYTMQVMAV